MDARVRRPTLTPEQRSSAALGAIGLAVTIAFWWISAATWLADNQVPTPPDVLAVFHERGFDYYRRIFSVTVGEAARGYVVGVGAALVLAALVLLVPWLEPVVMQLAVVTYCVPIVALAPILIIVHDLPDGYSQPAVDLAAISVFFTTVVGAVLGFCSAEQSTLDVVSVYGGGKAQQLFRVRLVAALPALFTTLQIAAPAAYLGALLGEYFHRQLEVGVGPSLILAQNNRETPLAWSLGITCALVAGTVYVAIGLLGRLVTPWSKGTAR